MEISYRDKVAWLGRYRDAVSSARFLEDELAALRQEAARAEACMDGPRPCVERLRGMQKNVEQQLEICMDRRTEVTRAIAGAPCAADREVLRRRYLLGQTYEEIADAMGVVPRRVYQLHRRGVERLELPPQT